MIPILLALLGLCVIDILLIKCFDLALIRFGNLEDRIERLERKG